MVVTLFTSRVILNTLGASDYGIYNVVGGIVTMMGFINGALAGGSSRFLTYELGSGNSNSLNNTFSAALNLHILVAVLVVLVGETIGLWFLYNKLVIPDDRMVAAFWLLQFSIMTTCINFTQLPYSASLIAHENMSIYAYIGLYEAVSKLTIAYVISISPIDNLIFYGALLMFNTAVMQMFYRLYTKKKYTECRFRLVTDKELYKKLANYSGWDLFGNMAVVCQNQGISILLNMFFGPIVNAARALSLQVNSAVTSFISNFLTAVRPQVIKSCSLKDYDRMYNLTFNSMKFSFLLMLAISMPIIFEIHYILQLWLGDTVPENTAIFTIIVLLNGIFQTWHTGLLMPYHGIGKIKKGNIFGGSLMILSLPISYVVLKFGCPAWSVLAVILIVNIIVQTIVLLFVRHYVRFSIIHAIKKVYLPSITIAVLSLPVPFLIVTIMQTSFQRLMLTTFSYEILLAFLVWIIALDSFHRDRIKGYCNKYIKRKT